MNNNLFRYKYEGGKEVEAITLLQSQLHFINALNLIQEKLYPTFRQEILYLPSKEGSHELIFNIDWEAIAGIFQGLSFKDVMATAKTSIETFADLVKLHKQLKGKKPENEVPTSGSIININLGSHNTFNVQGNTLDFYKKNPKVIEEIINSFTALENNQNVQGIQVSSDIHSQPLLQIPQKQFAEITLPNPYIEAEQTEKLRLNVSVFVKTPDFYPKPKKNWQWVFLYNNRPIKASTTDTSFKEMMYHGLRYGQGDRLIVDLKLTYKRDQALNAYVIRRYEITKVHNSIFRDDQNITPLL